MCLSSNREILQCAQGPHPRLLPRATWQFCELRLWMLAGEGGRGARNGCRLLGELYGNGVGHDAAPDMQTGGGSYNRTRYADHAPSAFADGGIAFGKCADVSH